ncbi:MAG: RNase adapter RapZ [Candidatus Carbobacillus altaicus]|uniref:Hypothetical ATP-binding protein UPF0042, contains P-loop n=1 Tax=Candidatus Carbonibacillus altaicus TaxID=2163959 RepID=A0A2R6XYM3_9BACL|nr:RNase adapter RapZ [Candidatus Carbobacillus altaicus]PTQ55531.1 MAG: Hypothetical ATP-binding protein UPF0042, contains P-loop [Candidatus Carbobacillus altaicus]
MPSDPQLFIITGLSGAGKTVFIKRLEELGYFCVDNLPPALLGKFAELLQRSQGEVKRAALVVDLRGRAFFDALSDALFELETMGLSYTIVFLDARDDVLIRRYKASRKAHPLSDDGSIVAGIKKEREALEALRRRADQLIDTSDLKPQDLRELVTRRFAPSDAQGKMRIHLMSFGFKHGPPQDADLVLDVRFLPNPHYIPELKPLTGKDQPVYDYVLSRPETEQFIKRLLDLLHYTLPLYKREGKAELVIALGCTGGQHRSVALAEYLRQVLGKEEPVTVSHRDIDKDRERL